MATVYLADDLKHDRKVAVKVLRPELAAVLGADRFVQEIKTTASLQHPHILPLFDSGEADGFLFYVMPYIEGETLRDKLERETQLGIDEAVRITTEVADALDYAHRHNVIHRDIKPESILLHDDRPMVADFGIALAVSAAAGGRMTETGMSLGTPHYMSPEQATADKDITARSDVYSLGSVLYEMLTGHPPHTGSSAQQIIMKIIAEPVAEVTTLRRSVPPPVAAALAGALEKLPADRWGSAREFADVLTGVRTVARGATTTRGAGRQVTGWTARVTLREALAWAVAGTAIAVTAWMTTRTETVGPMMRLAVELPDSIEEAGSYYDGTLSVALSRDGSTIAFVARPVRGDKSQLRVYVRHSADEVARALSGTEGATAPTFSPAGDWIAYMDSSRTLRRIPVSGGTSQFVADSVGAFSWADNGTIYFSRSFVSLSQFAIWAVNAEGGRPRPVVFDSAATAMALFDIDVLPGSAQALVTRVNLVGDRSQSIILVDLDDGGIRELGISGRWPRFASPGYVLYVPRNGALMAAPFSLRTGAITGDEIRVPGVTPNPRGDIDYGVGGDGTLVFRWTRTTSLEPTRLAVVAPGGSPRVIRSDSLRYDQPAVSPDGQRLVVRLGGSAFNTGDLWVFELSKGADNPQPTAGSHSGVTLGTVSNVRQREPPERGARRSLHNRASDRPRWNGIQSTADSRQLAASEPSAVSQQRSQSYVTQGIQCLTT